MTDSALQKASLQPFSGETAEAIDLMFNPTQLAFARTVKWQSEQGGRGQKSALPKVNFSGVDPYKLTLNQLVFDTYEEGKSVVDKYIKKLKKGVEAPEGENKRPPVYILVWGGKSSFPCVMLSLTYKLDMFCPTEHPFGRWLIFLCKKWIWKIHPVHRSLPPKEQPVLEAILGKLARVEADRLRLRPIALTRLISKLKM